jgi:hypothetical protein
MANRSPSPLSVSILCGEAPPGPLDGLIEVLRAAEGDPLHSARIDADDLHETVGQVVALLSEACRQGTDIDGLYQPSMWARRDAVREAAALLAEAKATAVALRKSLDVLLPVVTMAAALVEYQTNVVTNPR